MRWQQTEWRIQRAGYGLLFLVVIAGACGLFSKGWVSNRQISAADQRLTVEYEGFGRRQSTMNMTLHLQQLNGAEYQVVISSEKMNDFQVQTLQPQPDESWSRGDQLILRWQRRPQQESATVWLAVQPKTFGRLPLRVTLDARSQVTFTSFIYP
ncbi:hypothetical protein [[Erwinia] mediterraneensis]|uniref:hypothetical protein n=1 Tax=[Erwinia] mediterraneensis TaxID=2161819 RepID=UPI00102FFB7D|nr:hypothetical protein [[Erwinia] mediterraneensis]